VRRTALPFLALALLLPAMPACDPDTEAPPEVATVTLTTPQVHDKILGGWVGQMVGVVASGFTEFGYLNRTIPEGEVPEWDPFAFFTAWMQDDLYVEIPFLAAMETGGVRTGWKALGDSFVDTQFQLWHGNLAARDALKAGLGAPASGHYANNEHCDDIDWQIEADYLGLMAPGLTRQAVELAWRQGHVVGFGDGVYGGVFVAAMHAEAFVATNVAQVIDAGLAAIPDGTQFKALLLDVVDGHARHPDDWMATWQEIQDRWGDTDRCPYGHGIPYNIDAKLNAGYVLMGLLYGDGDFWKSVVISMRCGQDSDCNPSTVGGILGTLYGYQGIPAQYVTEMDDTKKFDYTDWTLPHCVDATEALARQAVVLAGGSIRTSEGGVETWTIPRPAVTPLVLEQWPVEANEAPVLAGVEADVEGRAVDFHAEATDADGIAGYLWSFGDLDYGDRPVLTHVYAVPGTYEAIVWAADTKGNTSWKAVTVTVP
jgi:hypothetical protein